MYINFRIAKKYGLAYEDIIVLQAIKQNRTEDMYDVLCELFIGDLARHYTSLGLIEHVKPKKKDQTLTMPINRLFKIFLTRWLIWLAITNKSFNKLAVLFVKR
jgi:hypothetical protein